MMTRSESPGIAARATANAPAKTPQTINTRQVFDMMPPRNNQTTSLD
jgi:hypothetical protein